MRYRHFVFAACSVLIVLTLGCYQISYRFAPSRMFPSRVGNYKLVTYRQVSQDLTKELPRYRGEYLTPDGSQVEINTFVFYNASSANARIDYDKLELHVEEPVHDPDYSMQGNKILMVFKDFSELTWAHENWYVQATAHDRPTVEQFVDNLSYK